MLRLTAATFSLLLGVWLGLAYAQPAAELEGSWIAVKSERDGTSAVEAIGHRLSFADDRFKIEAKDGKPLSAGTFRLDPHAKPAAIDFEHTEGPLMGKTWLGIYDVDGDSLSICDNAVNMAKQRPVAFAAKPGSGYVVLRFKRVK